MYSRRFGLAGKGHGPDKSGEGAISTIVSILYYYVFNVNVAENFIETG
jgi:hypothetical protein